VGSFVQPTTTDEDGADGINEIVHGVDIGSKIRLCTKITFFQQKISSFAKNMSKQAKILVF
jgi:hypothetical protein